MPIQAHTSTTRPVVSVILAVRNEAPFIEQVIMSLLQQDAPEFDLEILVVDGNSSDGTMEIVRRMTQSHPRMRLLVNKHEKAPFAFNLGLREAKGEYVCILGAHTIYERNYISVCLNELKAHGAVGCSGRVITCPSHRSLQARLVGWALSHPFGSSRRSVRTQQEGFVDTIPYPVMCKEALIEAGGYDEELHRNQDNDMNQKLRARGHKLFLTDKTQCLYFVKSTIGSLLRYAFHTGYWNLISFRKNKSSMGLRHFVPFVLVLALGFAIGMQAAAFFVPGPDRLWFLILLFTLVSLHILLGFLAAMQVSIRERTVGALLLPLVFLSFHLSYGLGTLWAVLRNARSSRLPVTAAARSHVAP